jgi:hypothetical protein
MDNSTIVIAPLLALLRSRRFMVMVIGALVSIVISLVPSLEPARADLLNTILILAGIAVGGFSLEDAAAAHGEAQVKAFNAQSQSAQTAQAATPSAKDDKWRG